MPSKLHDCALQTDTVDRSVALQLRSLSDSVTVITMTSFIHYIQLKIANINILGKRSKQRSESENAGDFTETNDTTTVIKQQQHLDELVAWHGINLLFSLLFIQGRKYCFINHFCSINYTQNPFAVALLTWRTHCPWTEATITKLETENEKLKSDNEIIELIKENATLLEDVKIHQLAGKSSENLFNDSCDADNLTPDALIVHQQMPQSPNWRLKTRNSYRIKLTKEKELVGKNNEIKELTKEYATLLEDVRRLQSSGNL